jgi:hypothetical protein
MRFGRLFKASYALRAESTMAGATAKDSTEVRPFERTCQ